jgi:uncharacterized membrane protein
MKLRLSVPERILSLAISFTLLLLAVRIFYSDSAAYLFYPWNIFLAVIPIYFSRKLNNHTSLNWKSILLLAGWLLFFPNAPYIVTDVLHFYQRPGVPLWYDLVLILSAAWSGLMAGFISLMQVDGFISRHANGKWRTIITVFFLFAASIGIYLGRFLRFNSWDVVTKPGSLLHVGAAHVFKPFQHMQAWGFCVICTMLLVIIYYSIKLIPVPGEKLSELSELNELSKLSELSELSKLSELKELSGVICKKAKNKCSAP